MKCPDCNTEMQVTHSYSDPAGKTQRWVCKCGTVLVSETTVVAVNPGRGKGAYARHVQRMKNAPKQGRRESKD